MKLITYVINCLFLLACITTIAMQQSLMCKKATQTHVNSLLKKINEEAIHDNSNVMNMVRENGKNKEGETFDGIDPKRPVIKLYAHY